MKKIGAIVFAFILMLTSIIHASAVEKIEEARYLSIGEEEYSVDIEADNETILTKKEDEVEALISEATVDLTADEQIQLTEEFQKIQNYVEEKQSPVEISLDNFLEEYDATHYGSVEEYASVYYDLVDKVENDLATYSSSGKWYYNTGTSLPQAASYDGYNLLSTVRTGDIIFDAQGSWGLSGHLAIVEGKYYSATHKQFYVRVIEAIGEGVCRSVIDDQRVAERRSSVYRVTNATNDQRNEAVNFCKKQLGKKYSYDFLSKDYLTSETEWYCSELIRAAYLNQGINLETTSTPNSPGSWPLDIISSNKVAYCGISGTKPENLFTDIGRHWANLDIRYVVKNGIMNGTESTKFSPDLAVTRATLVTVLYRLENSPTVGRNTFSDVPNGTWYTDAVTWANQKGIANGYSSTSFGPNDIVTREQAATFLFRYASYRGYNTTYSNTSLNNYSDRNSVSSYALTAMRWAVSRGIISGTTSTTLSPRATLSRAQLARMTKYMLEKTAK